VAGLSKRLERGGKALLRKGFHLIPRDRPVPVEDLSAKEIGRILVVRLDNRMGNLLLITPALNGLRRSFPNAKIDLLVNGVFSPILHGNPHIDRLVVVDKAGFIFRPWRFLRFVADMRAGRYELAVDMSSSHSFSVTSACAVRLTGAPFRLGFRRGESDRFLNVLVDPPEGRMHEAAVLLWLLEGLNAGERVDLRLGYSIGDDEVLAGRKAMADLGFREGPVIGLFLGARGEKAWGDQNFLALAEDLSRDSQVLILGGKDEAERLGAVRGMERTGIRVAPLLPVRRFAALVRQCTLFISGDCGPMHLASALGVRVLAIFNVDNTDRYGPLGRGHRILQEDWEKTPAHVAKAAREMLTEVGTTPAQSGEGRQ
jgi:ADP-heptose:LPS heptosyltransferase